MRRRIPDIAKIRNLIGFAPSLDIKGILDSVINFYQQ